MIPNHSKLAVPFKLRFAGIVLALLLAVGGGFYLWAQDPTPIIIGDGSLTMESRGVPWSNFTGGGNTKTHPQTGKSVPQVAITMPGHTQTLTFRNQKCTVTVTYAGTTITVTTGNNGRRLQVTTNFNSFHQGATPNFLEHNNGNAKISHVTVVRGNQTIFDANASGGTRIEISYQ